VNPDLAPGIANQNNKPIGLLLARDELLEARVFAQRIEVGVDLQPAGRKLAWPLQRTTVSEI
jgi:hypothetical protein